ncbi:MAG TPA: hypothetical protein VHT70_04290 [Candidatus Saccharimonadales bacterium]|jgi:hypothetical protein|nr:hypothetical protein [Candidatus Saccharimonadales bacterium]
MKEFVPSDPITPLTLHNASIEVYGAYDKSWTPGINATDILLTQQQDAGKIFVDQYSDTSIQEVRTNSVEPQQFPLEGTYDAEGFHIDRYAEAKQALEAQHLPYHVDLLQGLPQRYGSWRFEGRVASMGEDLADKERIADYLTHENPLAGAAGMRLPGVHGDAYRLLGVVSDVMDVDEARAKAANNDSEDFVTYDQLYAVARDMRIPAVTFRNVAQVLSRINIQQMRQPNIVANSKSGPVAFDGQVLSRREDRIAFEGVSREALAELSESVFRKGASRELLKTVVAESAPKDTTTT